MSNRVIVRSVGTQGAPGGVGGSIASTQIADSTTQGRALLTAADVAAQRTALGLGTAAILDAPVSGDASSSQVVKGNDSRISGAAIPTDATTLYSIGDSFTYGSGATTYASGYVAALAAAIGFTSVNLGNGSFTIADSNWSAFSGWSVVNNSQTYSAPANVAESQSWSVLVGFNDIRTSTTSAAMYRKGLDHLIHWLAIPHTAKRLPQSPDSSTGTWTPSAWSGGLGAIATSSSSGSLTFNNVIGSEIYIGYLGWIGAAFGSITVTVDGVAQPVVATGSAAYGNRVEINGSDASIPNSVGPYGNGKMNFCPQLIRVTGLGMGAHTVVVTVSGNPTHILWVAGNGNTRTVRMGPNVLVGTIPRQSPWTAGGTDTLHQAFNTELVASVAAAKAAGLRVTTCPVASFYVPATHQSGDAVHPNNAGHAAIAQAFRSALVADIVSLVSGSASAASALVVGAGSFTTLNTSGAATLNSLTVVGASALTTLSTSGAATLASLTVSGVATVTGQANLNGGIVGAKTLAGASGTEVAHTIGYTVNQSGTAGSYGLLLNCTSNTLGSGSHRAIIVNDDGVSRFWLQLDGRMIVISPTGTVGCLFRGDGATDSQIILQHAVAGLDRRMAIFGDTISVFDSAGVVVNTLNLGDVTGLVNVKGRLQLKGGATLSTGTGAPSSSEVDGSVYLRTDGTGTTTIYNRAGGAWVAVGGGSGDTVSSISYAASITPDLAAGNIFAVGTLTGNITINAPTGTLTDGKRITFRLNQDATGGRTMTWNAVFRFGIDLTSGDLSTTPSVENRIVFQYNSTSVKWEAIGLSRF